MAAVKAGGGYYFLLEGAGRGGGNSGETHLLDLDQVIAMILIRVQTKFRVVMTKANLFRHLGSEFVLVSPPRVLREE